MDFSSNFQELPGKMVSLSKLDEALFNEVSWNRDVSRVQSLLLQGADVDATDKDLNTPLSIVAENLISNIVEKLANEPVEYKYGASAQPADILKTLQYIESRVRRGSDIVCLLLRYKSNVHTNNIDNWTPLHKVSVDRSRNVNMIVLDLLFNDLDASWESQFRKSLTAAFDDAAILTMKLLLSNGARINARTEYGDTPLHKAAEASCSIGCVQVLLEHGADVNTGNTSKKTPLHLAAWYSTADIVNILLDKKAEVNARDDNDVTPLHLAAQYGTADTVKILLDKKAEVNARDDDNYLTPLHLAATRQDPSIAKMLLEHGADQDGCDRMMRTPLHAAAEQFEEYTLDCVILLLKHRADVNACDENGCTPLHLTAQEDIAEVLLAYGANVDARDTSGETPLHKAAKSDESSIAELLLDNGAEVNVLADNKSTPLHSAAGRSSTDCVKLLIKYGADVNVQDVNKLTPLHYTAIHNRDSRCMKSLIKYGANVNIQDDQGLTALHYAVRGERYRNLDCVHLLLDCGANVNAQDNQGNFPIHEILSSSSLKDDDVRDVTNLLIKHGADLECRNYLGQTPAHIVFRKGIIKISKIEEWLQAITQLYSLGVDVNAKDLNGDTPYTYFTRINPIIPPGTVLCENSYRQERSMVVNHMKKLIALGAARIAEKNQPLFFDIMRPPTENYVSLTLPTGDDRNHYEKCVLQMEYLKSIRVFQNITLANFLTLRSPVTLAKIFRSDVFRKSILYNRLDKVPDYALALKLQYRKSLDMEILCDEAKKSIEILFSRKLASDCAYEILQYLSEDELNNLSEFTK